MAKRAGVKGFHQKVGLSLKIVSGNIESFGTKTKLPKENRLFKNWARKLILSPASA